MAGMNIPRPCAKRQSMYAKKVVWVRGHQMVIEDEIETAADAISGGGI